VAVVALEGNAALRAGLPGLDDLRADLAAHLGTVLGRTPDEAALTTILTELVSAQPHEERILKVPFGTEAEPLEVASRDCAGLVEAHVSRLAAGVREALDEAPPRLRSEVHGAAVVLTGGGALLEGLAPALSAAIGYRVQVAAEPALCCVRGALAAFDQLDVMRRNLLYMR
jgi:rod shape-determining protein MreB